MLGKYLGVLLDAVMYPFKHLKDISGLLLMTLVVFVAITYIGALIPTYSGLTVVTMKGFALPIDIIIMLLLALALMPLVVGVARHIVLDEKIESGVLDKMFKAREVMTFIAWVKLYILYIVPVLVAGIVITMMGKTAEPDVLIGLGTELTAEHLVMWLGVLIGVFLVARGSMMVICGALDKGIKVNDALAITKSNMLFVILAFVSLVIVLCVLYHALLYINAMVIDLKVVKDLLAMDIIGKLVVMVVSDLIKILGGVILVAGLADIYKGIKAK